MDDNEANPTPQPPAVGDDPSTPDLEQAAEKREAALADVKPGSMEEALLREREGYVVRGLDDRVAQVDAQLAARGSKPPKGRSARPGRTATSRRGRRTAD